MNPALNQVDLAFVVDTTGSMSPFILAAQQQMVRMIDELVDAAAIDLQLAIVQYRDHPPQEASFVYHVEPFTGELQAAQNAIQALSANGGGDAPEAVVDGVLAACHELEWRTHAQRIVVLVGDAPPHGIGAPGDMFVNGCPCGETVDSVTAAAEHARVTVYGLAMHSGAMDAFSWISQATGGVCYSAENGDAAIEHIKTLLVNNFSDLAFDERVLQACQAQPDFEIRALAEQFDVTRAAVAAAVSRLQRRLLLD
jgi:Mg-chelatase subunit ChlD